VRLLSVGWDLEGPGITKADFPNAESFASFDAVLLDPSPLGELWRPYAELGPDGIYRLYPNRDFGLSRALLNLFHLRQKELEDLLFRAGGVLVVRVRPPGEGLTVEGNPQRRLDIYSFLPKASLVSGPHHLSLPQGLRFLPRRGQDVLIPEPAHPLSPYLERFSRHGYEAVLTSVFGVPLSSFGTVLAQNRVGDPLALDLPVGLGRIVFLPSFVGQEAKEAGELLRVGLSALLSQPLPAAAPEWLEKYRLPGEEEIRKAAEELSREKERLNRKEQELQEAQKDLDTLKALLFPKSRMAFLHGAIAAFSRLGFSVKPGLQPMEFFAESPEENFYVRVSFSPFSPVGPEEHRALLLSLDRLRNEERKEVKGFLLCLSQPELEPHRRGPQWQEAVERASFDHHLVLASSFALFQAVAQALSGTDPRILRKSLSQTEGPWSPRF